MSIVPKDSKFCWNCPVHSQTACSLSGSDGLSKLEKEKFYRSYVVGQPVVLSGACIECS